VRFKTETGSVYSLNETDRTIARITGAGEPTDRIAAGRKYDCLDPHEPEIGKSLIIVWGDDTPPLTMDSNALRTTITSRIVEIL
jgi:hypothetical protein